MTTTTADDPAVFLGVRVNVNVETLPDAYQRLELRVRQVVASYLDDGDEEQAYRLLADLKLQDRNGILWTVAATTGRWMFRLPGSRNWQAGHPSMPPALAG